jgi:hypothetical protein
MTGEPITAELEGFEREVAALATFKARYFAFAERVEAAYFSDSHQEISGHFWQRLAAVFGTMEETARSEFPPIPRLTNGVRMRAVLTDRGWVDEVDE